jgi:hypothetical protein
MMHIMQAAGHCQSPISRLRQNLDKNFASEKSENENWEGWG